MANYILNAFFFPSRSLASSKAADNLQQKASLPDLVWPL